MRVTLAVDGANVDPRSELDDLRTWLHRQPELRTALRQRPCSGITKDTMGPAHEVLQVLLEPGGATTALAAGLVAWLQTRRGNQSVTIRFPDGTEVTVTEKARDAREASEVALRVAETVRQRAGTDHGDGIAEEGGGAAEGDGGT